MFSEKQIDLFKRKFELMDGDINDEEFFLALAKERLRLRKNKNRENHPDKKSTIYVTKDTPLPQQVTGTVLSKNVVAYKRGVYIGRVGLAMLITPAGRKFVIFEDVQGYSDHSTLKRLSLWCFNGQEPLKFHRNCLNYYVREDNEIWWRLSFRTEGEANMLLKQIDGVNIKLIRKPTNLPEFDEAEAVNPLQKLSKRGVEEPKIEEEIVEKNGKKSKLDLADVDEIVKDEDVEMSSDNEVEVFKKPLEDNEVDTEDNEVKILEAPKVLEYDSDEAVVTSTNPDLVEMIPEMLDDEEDEQEMNAEPDEAKVEHKKKHKKHGKNKKDKKNKKKRHDKKVANENKNNKEKKELEKEMEIEVEIVEEAEAEIVVVEKFPIENANVIIADENNSNSIDNIENENDNNANNDEIDENIIQIQNIENMENMQNMQNVQNDDNNLKENEDGIEDDVSFQDDSAQIVNNFIASYEGFLQFLEDDLYHANKHLRERVNELEFENRKLHDEIVFVKNIDQLKQPVLVLDNTTTLNNIPTLHDTLMTEEHKSLRLCELFQKLSLNLRNLEHQRYKAISETQKLKNYVKKLEKAISRRDADIIALENEIHLVHGNEKVQLQKQYFYKRLIRIMMANLSYQIMRMLRNIERIKKDLIFNKIDVLIKQKSYAALYN